MRLMLLILTLASLALAQNKISPEQVNGTWVVETGPNSTNTWRVWAVGDNRYRVEFYGIINFGNRFNSGYATGTVQFVGDLATLRLLNQPNCVITLRWLGRSRLEVREVTYPAACGFGLNVSSEGVYRRTAVTRPVFGR
jgi:hypothetical protein